MTRSRAAFTAVIGLALAGLAPLSPSPVLAAGEATLVADPLPTWQVSGKVWALAYAQGVVYVGGTFGSVRPPGAPAGTNEVPRSNFAAFDANTGELLPNSACSPAFTVGGTITPSIEGMEVSTDGTTLYVGGRFSRVDGTSVGNFAALDLSSCALKPGYPRFDGMVRAFAPTPSTVYVGGSFTTAGNQPRTRLAAITPTGTLLPWAPTADGSVQALTVAPDLSRVYAGGDFLTVDEQAIQGLVALDPIAGSVLQAFPGWIIDRESVKALAHDNKYFYLAAEGTGKGQFDGRIAADVYTGELHWRDTCTGATQDIEPHQGVLYSASHAHDCSHQPDGFPDYAMDGRQHLLAESISDETILPWFPDTNEGVNNVGVGPHALVMANDILWVGGTFTTVNKKPQQALTRLPSGPDVGNPDRTTPTAASSLPGTVDIAWPATWDRDDGVLTYALYRDDSPTPLYTTQVRSRYWDRPTITFQDLGLVSGSVHEYRVTVSDEINTTTLSVPATVTVS